MISFVLRPTIPAASLGLLTLLAGAAWAEAGSEISGLEVRCKWPNDLMTADGKVIPAHHPFTRPHPEDLDRLESDPMSVRSLAYDLVLNGIELGSGSVRIHDPVLQQRIFTLLGIGPEEQVVIAHVARYHRGSAPKRKHEAWWQLDRDAREKVRRLAAILRIADGFDRGHASAVDKVKVRWLERAIRLTPTPRRANDAMRLELWGAARKAALLEELTGVPVEVVAADGQVVESE